VKTILLVDDEHSIVEMLSYLLEEEGYAVITAFKGREALDRVAEKVPDLILSDLMMPVMNGLELLQSVARNPALKRVPVILITSAPMAAPAEAGWADCLVKPFEFEELARAIQRVLRSGGSKAGRNRREAIRQRRRLKVKLGNVVSFTRDVSLRGFSTEAMRVLPAGASVQGSLEAAGETVAFTGRIIWSIPGDPHMNIRGRMGISFTNPGSDLLEFLRSH
jgi:CheY-like chemotaxis protein